MMNSDDERRGRSLTGERLGLWMVVAGWGGLFAIETGRAQTFQTTNSPSAAQALKQSLQVKSYNQRYGPVRVKTSAGLGVYYTDNVFYSQQSKADMMVEPEAHLDALWPVTQLNALRLSLGLSYEWYLKNRALNSDAPLVNPGSELAWNLFVGDFHIRLDERFSYQQSLFFNSFTANQPFYNFNNVGTFSRLDNQAGFQVTWNLRKGDLSVGYNHENFISQTARLDYLDRASEWFTADAGYDLGDHLQVGLEGRGSLHNYQRQTVLNDNWRARVGPFVEAKLRQKITLRAGGGYDTARYGAHEAANSDYNSYYAYARVSQQTRLFTHSLEVGRELRLGDNANDMKRTYARYSITSPIIRHVDLGVHVSVNLAEEYGGPSGFDEKYTYYGGGLRVGYQFAKHWRADLSYEFLLKESDLVLRDFHRNQVGLEVTWTF